MNAGMIVGFVAEVVWTLALGSFLYQNKVCTTPVAREMDKNVKFY